MEHNVHGLFYYKTHSTVSHGNMLVFHLFCTLTKRNSIITVIPLVDKQCGEDSDLTRLLATSSQYKATALTTWLYKSHRQCSTYFASTKHQFTFEVQYFYHTIHLLCSQTTCRSFQLGGSPRHWDYHSTKLQCWQLDRTVETSISLAFNSFCIDETPIYNTWLHHTP